MLALKLKEKSKVHPIDQKAHKQEPVACDSSSYYHKDKIPFTRSNTPSVIAEEESIDEFDDFANPTPPISRNGFYTSPRSRSITPAGNSLNSSKCSARTRLGTPCKITAAPGRSFCYRHQAGDSVMGDK